MELKPTSGRIIVKVLEAEEKTSGGLFLADESKEEIFGKVLSVCDDWDDYQAYSLNVGDKVLFGKFSGVDAKVEDQEVKVLTYKEVILIV